MKIKNKKWSQSDKFLYGDIMHVALEHLAKIDDLDDFKKILRSKYSFNQFLLEHLIFIDKQYVLDSIFNNLKKLNLVRLHNFFRSYLNRGYEIRTENTIIIPDKRTNKFIFLRPDIVFINKRDKLLMLLELKSGRKYDKKQLRVYKNALKNNMKAWKISGRLYLAGIDKLLRF